MIITLLPLDCVLENRMKVPLQYDELASKHRETHVPNYVDQAKTLDAKKTCTHRLIRVPPYEVLDWTRGYQKYLHSPLFPTCGEEESAYFDVRRLRLEISQLSNAFSSRISITIIARLTVIRSTFVV